LVAIPEFGGVIFVIDVWIVPVRRFWKFNSPGLSGLQVGDTHLWQPLLSLVGYIVVLEEVRIVEHYVGPMRHEFLPILAARSRDGAP
jgi:hypothetical protein